MILVSVCTIPADPGLQFTLFSSVQFAENPDTISDVADEFRNRVATETFAGIGAELVLEKLGFGVRYQSLFLEDTDDWWMDWKADAFVSYHLFGTRSFLDPFLVVGTGTAARVNIADDHVRTADEPTGITGMSVYQYAGAGGEMNFGGLVIGTALNYIVMNQAVESADAQWDAYPTDRFEVLVFGGVAVGR